MQEKRRGKRYVLGATIVMERVDSDRKKRVPIIIRDVSKSGLGFACAELLEMNSVYKVEMTIMTGDVVDTLINIVRFDNSSDDYVYGGTFVGMPEGDTSKFAIYEMFDDANNNN